MCMTLQKSVGACVPLVYLGNHYESTLLGPIQLHKRLTRRTRLMAFHSKTHGMIILHTRGWKMPPIISRNKELVVRSLFCRGVTHIVAQSKYLQAQPFLCSIEARPSLNDSNGRVYSPPLTLGLSGVHLFYMSYVSRHLSFNGFKGVIPPTLGNLTMLTSLTYVMIQHHLMHR